jgi:hypothetical protein
LKWLSNPGLDGKPLLGVPPDQPVAVEAPVAPAEEPAEVEAEPLQGAGKTLFIRQFQERRRAKLERESGGK